MPLSMIFFLNLLILTTAPYWSRDALVVRLCDALITGGAEGCIKATSVKCHVLPGILKID